MAQHALPRDRQLGQSDRPWSPDDGKRGLPQLRALDPMPVLGGAGGVSSVLNGIMNDQVHLEVHGGDQLDGLASVVALDLGLAGD